MSRERREEEKEKRPRERESFEKSRASFFFSSCSAFNFHSLESFMEVHRGLFEECEGRARNWKL